MKRINLLLSVAVVLSATTHVVAAQTSFIDSYATPIQALLEEKFAQGNSGMVIALVEEKGSRAFAAGKLDNGTEGRIDADTIFELGSVTKVFTSLLLLDAARRGEMNLDDPVAKYLPAGVRVPARDGKQITLVHLAAQESGLPWHADDPGKKPGGEISLEEMRQAGNAYTVEDMYGFLSRCSLKQVPGSAFEYSNVGMALLGRAIELKTGKEFDSLVVERICRPLNMESTRITLTEQQKARLARGHWLDGSRSGHVEFQAMRPAGSLLSTANDLVKFMSANLGFVQNDLTPLLKQMQIVRHTDGPRFGRTAMPWFDERNYNPPGTELLGHGGGGLGNLAFVAFDTIKRRGVIVLTNQMSVNPYSIGWTIIQGLPLSRENAMYGVREVVGVGIALASDPQSGAVRISTVFPKSPAGAAGLVAGLLLKKIDGVSIEGKTLKECVGMLGGAAETKVRLEVFDPAQKQERTVELTRQKFLTLMGEAPK